MHYKSTWKPHQDARLLDPLWPGHKNKDCSCSRQGLTPVSSSIQCQPTASKKWYAFKESKFCIKEFPRLVLFRRQYSKMPVSRSSSTIKVHHLAAGDRLRKKTHLKVDLRLQGIPQDAVLEDRGRVTKIQELVDKLRSEYRTDSVIAALRRKWKIQQVQ